MNTRPSRRFLPSDVGIARSQGQPTGKKLGHIDYSTSLTILLANGKKNLTTAACRLSITNGCPQVQRKYTQHNRTKQTAVSGTRNPPSCTLQNSWPSPIFFVLCYLPLANKPTNMLIDPTSLSTGAGYHSIASMKTTQE